MHKDWTPHTKEILQALYDGEKMRLERTIQALNTTKVSMDI